LHSELTPGKLEDLKKIVDNFSDATDYAILFKSPQDEIGLQLLENFQNILETEQKPLIFTVPKC